MQDLTKKLSDSEAQELVVMLEDFEASARDVEEQRGWKATAEKCQKYVYNEQWDEGVRAKLEAKGTLPLTVNRVLPVIKFLIGTFIQNAKDIKCEALRGGTEIAAQVITALSKHALSASHAEAELMEMFEDGVSCGRGAVKIVIDRNEPFGAELRAQRLNPFDVRFDPNATEYDPNISGMYVVEREWVSKDRVAVEFPHIAEKIGGSARGGIVQMLTSLAGAVGRYVFGHGDPDDETDDPVIDSRRKYQVRVKICHWKKHVKRTLFLDKQSWNMAELDPEKDGKKIKQAKEVAAAFPDRWQIAEGVTKQVLYRTKWVSGAGVLEHIEDPYNGLTLFPVARFTPFWKDGFEMSIVEPLMSPQDEHNKTRTANLDILKRCANGGWMYQAGSLSPEMEETLRKLGSTPGITLKYEVVQIRPTQIQPTQMSAGHYTAGQTAAQDIMDIAGVSAANQARPTKSGESGILRQQTYREGLTVNEIVFERFSHSLRLFGDVWFEMLRRNDIYTEDEIRQVLDLPNVVDDELRQQAYKRLEQEAAGRGMQMPKFAPPPQQPNPEMLKRMDPRMQVQAMAQFEEQMNRYNSETQARAALEDAVEATAEQMILESIRNWAVGKYGVTVSESPAAPTARMQAFYEISEIAKTFPQMVSPKTFIEASSLPKATKDALIKDSEQAAGRQAG